MRRFLIITIIFMGIALLIGINEIIHLPIKSIKRTIYIDSCSYHKRIISYYLYKKVPNNKIDWALFGFIGNLNAILFYYCRNYHRSLGKK